MTLFRFSILLILWFFIPNIALSQKFISHNAASVEAYNQTLVYCLAGDFVNAEQMARDLVARDPGFVEARSLLALICSNVGKREESARIASQALELNPKDALALAVRGQEDLYNGDIDGAIAEFQKSLVADINQPLVHAALAEANFQKHEFNKAVSSFKRAEALGLRNPRVFQKLGESYLALNQFSDAARTFGKAIAKSPENWILRKYYADALYGADSLEQAREAYTNAIRSFPNVRVLRAGLALVLMKQEKWQEARMALDSLSEANPCAPCYALQYATIAMRLNDIAAADSAYLSAYDNLCRLDKFVSCFVLQGRSSAGEATSLVFLINGVVCGDSVYYPLRFLAPTFIDNIRLKASSEWYSKFCKTYDQNWTHKEKAQAIAVHMTLNSELGFAEQNWKTVCELDSSDYASWLNYACVLHMNKNYTQAEEAYLNCLHLDPENLAALINLMTLCFNRGDSEQYTTYFDKLAKLDRVTATAAAAAIHGTKLN